MWQLNGMGARRSISKRNVNYVFYLNPRGHCEVVQEADNPGNELVVIYEPTAPLLLKVISKSRVDMAGNCFWCGEKSKSGSRLFKDQLFIR